ncbi:MAG TPA: TadE/TadG family type IV pilus assembly protein [Stellaceae bacterium]|nr:TadE/TadG family type IV pilus assembly protein [Stellaceae bacterium]
MSVQAMPPAEKCLGADAAGSVSVEFALLLPVLLTLFFGCYEASNLLLADLKVNDATQTAADLIAQTQTSYVLQTTDFTNFTSAAQQVMAPLPVTTQLKVAYASITYNTGKAVIDWHYEVNGATPIAIASIPANLGINSSTDSVVVVSAQYAYTSPITYVLNHAYTLNNTSYDRPRYVTCIPDFNNKNNVCP